MLEERETSVELGTRAGELRQGVYAGKHLPNPDESRTSDVGDGAIPATLRATMSVVAHTMTSAFTVNHSAVTGHAYAHRSPSLLIRLSPVTASPRTLLPSGYHANDLSTVISLGHGML